MKNAFVIILTLYSFLVCGQSMEVYVGGNSNHFFDRSNDSHHSSNYEVGMGYSIGIAMNEIKPLYFPMRVSLEYKNYGGKASVGDGGLAGWYRTSVETRKSVISLAIFPFKFNAKEKLFFHIGIEACWLVNESFEGNDSGWFMPNTSWNDDLQEKYDRFNSTETIGFVGRISYDINILESIILTPYYDFYYGLTSEFSQDLDEVRAFRNSIGIGIKKNINLPRFKLP